MVEAEEMYVRTLRGKEMAWGVEHTSTLDMVNNLGLLYGDQHKMVEAEEIYVQALRGYARAVGTDRWKTRTIARNIRNRRNPA